MKPIKMNHTLFKGINIKDMRNRTTGIVKVTKRHICKFRGDGPARWHTIYKGDEAFAENAKIPFNTRRHHWATRHLCMDCFEDWQAQCELKDTWEKQKSEAIKKGILDPNKKVSFSHVLVGESSPTDNNQAPKGQNRKANMKKNTTVKLTSGFLQGVEDAKGTEFTVKAITKDKKHVILVKKGALVGGSESNPIPISEVEIVMDEVYNEQHSTKAELAKWLNNSNKDIRELRIELRRQRKASRESLNEQRNKTCDSLNKIDVLNAEIGTLKKECDKYKGFYEAKCTQLQVEFAASTTLKEQLDLLQDKVFDKISCCDCP